ncbi:MAG TPA: threonine dehydratase, partial [Candidatus Saccharimonadia bacterium]
ALGAAGRHPLAASVTDQTVHVPESDVRRTLAELNQLKIQASPAGALAAAALTQLSSELAGRTVVVIISGAAIA